MPRSRKVIELEVNDLIKLAEQERLIGEFKNVSEDAYHSGPGVSRSDLAKLLKSPEHLEYEKSKEKTETTALMIGNAFHTYVLEPEKFQDKYVVGPEGKTRAHKAVKELIAECSDDQKVLTFAEDELISAMGEKVKEHPVIAEFLEGSDKEVTYYWKDPKTDILCKARLDIVHPKLGVMDLKTTGGDARRTEFSKSCLKYNYDLQAAHYWYGAAVSQSRDYKFYFGVVEKSEPHGVVVHKADHGFIECGLEIQSYLLKKLDDYINERIPTGYPPEVVNLALPPWGFDLDARLERYR